MGRHYRRSIPSNMLLSILLLFVLTAALIFVLNRLYPGHLLPPADRTDDIASVQKKPDAHTQVLSSDMTAETVKPAQQNEDDKRPVMALVVDDAGEQMKLTKRVADLSLPLTWAIMPYTKYARKTADLAAEKGVPYLLHLPMQAEVDKKGGPYLVGLDMSAKRIRGITASALDTLPDPIGISNHRGSLATSDKNTVEPVVLELKARQLMFLDSSTSVKSVAYDVAKAAGITALKNNGFIDGTPDENKIEAKFKEAVNDAVIRGSVIVICHFRPATVNFLEKLDAKYEKLPVRMVTIPEMAGILAMRGGKTDPK